MAILTANATCLTASKGSIDAGIYYYENPNNIH